MKSQDSIPIGTLLLSPAIAALDHANEVLARSGFEDIRPAHARALRYIGSDGARITDMASDAHMTKQSMSTLVAYLVDRGYLAFESDMDDKRAKRVVLTERGLAVQAQNAKAMEALERKWAEAIGGDRMRELRTLLEALDKAAGFLEKAGLDD